jgi:DMSO reductase anchor subunit
MKCPYEVPRYSARRGIVRKCDLCHGRLAEGEAPACVQACPNEAIRVTTVSTAWVRVEFRTPSKPGKWLPDSPDPSITLPTTRYITRAPEATLRAADHSQPKPQPAHWPLILLLVGTQAGIGGLALAAGMAWTRGTPGSNSDAGIFRLAVIAMAFLAAGLAGSVAHLGQPRKAWRVWLGWRTSWLSREAIALNAFAGAAATAAALIGLRTFPYWILSETPVGRSLIQLPPALWSIPLWGLAVAAVFAQTRVYSDTGRWCWRDAVTAPRFFGTMISLGCWLGLVLLGPISALLQSALLTGVIVANGIKLALELRAASGAGGSDLHPDESRRTVEFLSGTFRIPHAIRLLIGGLAGIVVPLGMLTGQGPAVTDASGSALVPMMALVCLGGEILERWLFFRTASPNRMPGMP